MLYKLNLVNGKLTKNIHYKPKTPKLLVVNLIKTSLGQDLFSLLHTSIAISCMIELFLGKGYKSLPNVMLILARHLDVICLLACQRRERIKIS